MSKNDTHPKFLDLQPGTYSDGHPLDTVHYLECKVILKPDRFTSVKSFRAYGALVQRAADAFRVGFSAEGVADTKPKIREVVFLDTADFRLYRHQFILRRRIAYEDNFPVGDPEIVFKFRHPDMQKTAELDVRPNISGPYQIKFKAEALPLKDQIGGHRLLFSHNVQFGLSQAPEGHHAAMANIARVFPCLQALATDDTEKVQLVNQTIVEEVLQDLGVLDFGKGVKAKANAALWRERGTHKPLAGEFSFQCKFQRNDELHTKAMERGKQFFITLQQIGSDWVSLGTTKTGIVYQTQLHAPDKAQE